ncbi:MAG: adenylate/guanylate cyclase domain-containing protein [Chloroflexota bacterium]
MTAAREPLDGMSAAELFRGLRHELRTPINHIIGYAELLLEEAGDLGLDGVVDDLNKIHQAGTHALALVNDALDVSRLATERPELDRLSEELRTPLTAIIGYSDLLQEEAEAEEYAELIPDLQRIETAGKHLLALVLSSADLSRRVESGGDAVLMPPDALPADPAPSSPAETPTPTVLPAVGTLGASLLVVDDNEANRDMLGRRLARLGFNVALAVDGYHALAQVATTPFDLILLDVMMPGIDGYEVLRRLKADDGLRHIPVIVLSASDEIESAVRCIELGAEDYLPKPIDAVLLRARIGASLEKKRLRDQEVVYLQQIDAERKRADELLHVILPGEVVAELKATNGVAPRRYENVAVLFSDIVGFTAYCDVREPHEVMPPLQQLVEAYEEIGARHRLQKIKTIGDSFMAAAGLLQAVEAPVEACVRAGLEMIAVTQSFSTGWDIRIGVHVGPVVAGVLGQRQYLFDLFGDTVNTAARMESNGVPGYITLSPTAWGEIEQIARADSLGIVEVKGKGPLELFRFAGFRA